MIIHDMHYLSGMPANDTYKLEVKKGIILELDPDEFKTLCDCISEKISKDQERIEKATKRYYERGEKIEAFVKDLQKIFYHGDEDCDILYRTEIKDIDEDKLFNALEHHKSILGLE